MPVARSPPALARWRHRFGTKVRAAEAGGPLPRRWRDYATGGPTARRRSARRPAATASLPQRHHGADADNLEMRGKGNWPTGSTRRRPPAVRRFAESARSRTVACVGQMRVRRESSTADAVRSSRLTARSNSTLGSRTHRSPDYRGGLEGGQESAPLSGTLPRGSWPSSRADRWRFRNRRDTARSGSAHAPGFGRLRSPARREPAELRRLPRLIHDDRAHLDRTSRDDERGAVRQPTVPRAHAALPAVRLNHPVADRIGGRAHPPERSASTSGRFALRGHNDADGAVDGAQLEVSQRTRAARRTR